MAESAREWDDILQSMEFPQQSQFGPMDVDSARLWCYNDKNNRKPSLVEEESRIGTPALSPCTPSKRLPPVPEWYLDDQSNFLPPLEDNETGLIASPRGQQLIEPTVDFFEVAQMAERLAQLENRYVDAI